MLQLAARLSQTITISEKMEDASLCGWLLKRGQVNTSLQKRFFFLHGACLSYFESEEAAMKGKANGQTIVTAVGHYREEDAPDLICSGKS